MSEKIPHDKSPMKYGPSVESPSDSREGLTKNCGGFPPTLEPKAIWAAHEPPDHPAENSVESRGSMGGKEKD